MICPKCQAERAVRNGGGRCYCPDCGQTSTLKVDQAVREAALARRGIAPAHDLVHPLPEGLKLKGTSKLVDRRTGLPVLEWVKTSEDTERQRQLFEAAVAAVAEKLPRMKARPAPQHLIGDLLNQYTITDYHLGMLAWGEETGADWDLSIAEDMLVLWFQTAIAMAPASETAVFAQLGDFLHWDGLDAVTPTSKHVLDADTRFQKLVRVAIRVLRRVIGMLLEKHAVVHVIMAEGNHDMASSIWLREWLAAMFENEPRVLVNTSPDPYYCVEHGLTALFYHHGHKKKLAQVDSVFAAKFREVFGRTKFAYGHTGHLHHDEVKETNLMTMEQHETLAAPDAHASRGGWMSGRSAKVITYSKRHGEVGRLRISSNMLDAAA